MNKFKMAFASLLAVGIVSAALVGIAGAQSFNTTVPKGTTIDSSVYSGAKHVVIEGTVNGDVYCGGQDIVIGGVVKGDVLCAGRHVTITGIVEGDIRIAAQHIDIRGTVQGNATLAGQEITMTKQATIGRDLTVMATNATLEGAIGRDVVANGTTHFVEAKIGRNLTFSGSQLGLRHNAVIGGGVYYSSKQNIDKADHAVVKGDVEHLAPKAGSRNGPFGISSKTLFLVAIIMFMFAMMLVLFAPQHMHKISMQAVEGLGKTALVGGLSMIIAPLIIALLCSTVVAMPVGILLLLIMLIVVLLSGPVTAYYLGSMIFAKSKNPLHIMAIGGAVLLVLYLLPMIGPLFMFIAYIIGSGAALRALRQAFPKPVYRVE